MVNIPVRLPLAVGVNVTDIWQVPPAATDAPQLLVSAKSPGVEIVVMLSVALPAFVKVTLCAALVVLAMWALKISDAGLSTGCGPTEMPDRTII